jgi:hypothetical protein
MSESSNGDGESSGKRAPKNPESSLGSSGALKHCPPEPPSHEPAQDCLWRVRGYDGAHMLCEATGIALTSPVYYLLCEADSDYTLTWHEARGEQSGIEHTNEGPRFNFRYADKRYHYFPDYITRDEVAALVKMLRSKAREAKESASLVT